MRLARSLVAIALLGAPALLLLPAASAWGGDAPAAAPSSSDRAARNADAPPADAGPTRRDPDNRTGLAEWMSKCLEGNSRYLSKDIPGAIDSYRQAIQLAPKKPLPHYLLAEAELGAGNLPEAEAAINDAEKASDDRDANVRGKILFFMADLKERQKNWDGAKEAWKVYGDYAAKHVDAGASLPTPPARIQAIDDMLRQDKAYDVVRQRIADEGKDAGPADAGKKK
jgi:tetratricopeptide (TPR) repeat protein